MGGGGYGVWMVFGRREMEKEGGEVYGATVKMGEEEEK
jgi:hypothetical protein